MCVCMCVYVHVRVRVYAGTARLTERSCLLERRPASGTVPRARWHGAQRSPRPDEAIMSAKFEGDWFVHESIVPHVRHGSSCSE